MQFSQTFSRSKLQEIPAQRRLQAIVNWVDAMHYSVIHAAASKKTSYLHPYPARGGMAGCHDPAQYIVTKEDIIEGLKVKFPDCDVSYVEEWIDVRPGHREQRSGIKIDWS